MTGQFFDSSALSFENCSWPAGTSSSEQIASTGHSGSQSVQSMHSSGSITSMFGPSWKQSTGHTSTQSVYLHLIQASVTTKVMLVLHKARDGRGSNGAEFCYKRATRAKPDAQAAALDLLRARPRPEPVERGLQHDLAAQAARRPPVEDAAEHAVFLGVGRRQLRAPMPGPHTRGRSRTSRRRRIRRRCPGRRCRWPPP